MRAQINIIAIATAIGLLAVVGLSAVTGFWTEHQGRVAVDANDFAVIKSVTERSSTAEYISDSTLSTTDSSSSDRKTRTSPLIGPSPRPARIFVEDTHLDQLFEDVPDSKLDRSMVDSFLENRHIDAYRIVNVDGDALRTRIREFPDLLSFEINLLDTESVTLVAVASVEHNDSWRKGYATWVGGVDGDETSSATFIVGPDGTVNGQVRTLSGGRVKLENISGTAVHLLWKRAPGFGIGPE